MYQCVIHYRNNEGERNIYCSDVFNSWEELCKGIKDIDEVFGDSIDVLRVLRD